VVQDVLPGDPPRPEPADLTDYPSDADMVAEWESGQQRAQQLAWDLRMRPAMCMDSLSVDPPLASALGSDDQWFVCPWMQEEEALQRMSHATGDELDGAPTSGAGTGSAGTGGASTDGTAATAPVLRTKRKR
jgi:hypothetical protein